MLRILPALAAKGQGNVLPISENHSSDHHVESVTSGRVPLRLTNKTSRTQHTINTTHTTHNTQHTSHSLSSAYNLPSLCTTSQPFLALRLLQLHSSHHGQRPPSTRPASLPSSFQPHPPIQCTSSTRSPSCRLYPGRPRRRIDAAAAIRTSAYKRGFESTDDTDEAGTSEWICCVVSFALPT